MPAREAGVWRNQTIFRTRLSPAMDGPRTNPRTPPLPGACRCPCGTGSDELWRFCVRSVSTPVAFRVPICKGLVAVVTCPAVATRAKSPIGEGTRVVERAKLPPAQE